jgi:hypothetical protein
MKLKSDLYNEPSYILPAGVSREQRMCWAKKIVQEIANERGVTVAEMLYEIEQELHMDALRKVLLK